MKIITIISFVLTMLLITLPQPTMAYVGPGLGLGAIGAILGVMLSIMLAIFAICWYPIKRLLGIGKRGKPGVDQGPNDEQ